MTSGRLLRIFYAGLFSLLNMASVQAQDPYFRDQQFEKINPSAKITALAQDVKGHIWIGSTGGLYRFDGFNFLDRNQLFSGSERTVRSICSLRNGKIMLGTEDGRIYVTDDVAGSEIKPQGFDTGFAVTDIVQTSANEIWIATYGNGIFRFRDSTTLHFSAAGELPDDFVYSLTVDRRGRIWAGTDNGIVCLFKLGTEYKTKKFGSDNGLPDNIVKVVEVGPTGAIWAGTFEKGIAILNESSGRFTIPAELRNWNHGHINSLVLLENEFWIGTDQHGILDYEFAALGRFRVFGPQNLYGHKSVECMLVDNSNNVWIACGNSLLFTPGERIEFINDACGKPMGNIRAVLSDKSGKIWASTSSGVISFYSDSAGRTVCTRPLEGTPYTDFNVVSFHEDKHGRIWIGTFDKGILVYDPSSGKIRNFTETDGLPNASVLSITGRGETIWLGTLGGITGCYLASDQPGSKPKFFSLPGKGPGNNFIYKVFEDSQGRLISGTDGEGVGVFNGTLYNSYGKMHGLKSGVVYSVTEDFQGDIWFAASEGGLYLLKDRSIRNYDRASGLSDLSISGLSTDLSGNILVVNKTGIDVLDPVSGHVVTLGEELGIKAIDPELNCISADPFGNNWIGTQNGIIKLRLGQRASAFVPELHLEKVLCFLQEVDTSAEKVFNYNRNHISFEYTGIWYDDPEAVTYRYRLEGYNTDWVVTRDRFVTFPSLSPGKYTFRIMSSLNGNFKDSKEVAYSFRINSPFWKSSWFLVLIILAAFVVLSVYLRFRDKRTRSLEALNKERILAQFEVLRNQVNPHFLFNSFNTLISIIEDDRGKAIDYVNKLSDFFRRILTHKEKDLIPLQEEIELLNDYLYLQKQRYGDAFIMDIRLPGHPELEKFAVPPLSLQMLVENAFKHNAVSKRQPLRIEIFVNETGNLVIRNNKIKKMNSEPSTGTGLANLSKRYLLLCGKEPVIHDNFDSFTVLLPIIRLN